MSFVVALRFLAIGESEEQDHSTHIYQSHSEPENKLPGPFCCWGLSLSFDGGRMYVTGMTVICTVVSQQ